MRSSGRALVSRQCRYRTYRTYRAYPPYYQPMTSQAVNDYNSLIERKPALLEESRAFLEERLSDVRFVFGGRMLSPFLRPHFVTREEWRQITRTCETVWGAIEKVGRV